MKKISKKDLEIKPRVVSQLNDTPNPRDPETLYGCESWECLQKTMPCDTKEQCEDISKDPCDTRVECPYQTEIAYGCDTNATCHSVNYCSVFECYTNNQCYDSNSHAALCCPETDGVHECPQPESNNDPDCYILETQQDTCAVDLSEIKPQLCANLSDEYTCLCIIDQTDICEDN